MLDEVVTLLHVDADSQRAAFIESLSRRLHVPLVTSSSPQPITGRRLTVTSSTVLYIRPPLLAAAVADVIVRYGWSRAYYVYDSSQGDPVLLNDNRTHLAQPFTLCSKHTAFMSRNYEICRPPMNMFIYQRSMQN